MEKLFSFLIVHYLKRTGFKSVSKHALHLFYLSTMLSLKNYLRTLKSITLHSQRSKTTILDVLKLQTLFEEEFASLKAIHRIGRMNRKEREDEVSADELGSRAVNDNMGGGQADNIRDTGYQTGNPVFIERFRSMKSSSIAEEIDQAVPCSLLGTNMDKYVHVYDFLPPFPPAHTFKKSFAKESEKEEKSKNIKRRLEESLVAENNLVRMMDANKEIPSVVNFMLMRK